MTAECDCGGTGRKDMFKPVNHVIFDLDGLMLDTEYVYEKVFQRIASQYGKNYTKDVRMKVMGTPEHDSARIAVTEMQLPISTDEFLEQYKPICKVELTHPPILPGVEKLVRHLYKNGIPMAIATSGAEDITTIKTKNYTDLFQLFNHTVCGTDNKEVKHGKPAPDIYLVCASKFPNKPCSQEVLVFEDAPNGVTGALRAGMQVVMVPAEEVEPEQRKSATLVLNSLVDFKPELFGLPPYDE